jgi:hypothetical protein
MTDKKEDIRGAIIFDMVGYFSERPNSQIIPKGMDQLFPDAYREVSNNQFRGDFLLNVANDGSRKLSAAFDDCLHKDSFGLKVISVTVPGNGEIAPDLRRSDHSSFWDKGLPCLFLGDGADTRNMNYHRSTDGKGTIDYKKISSLVKSMLFFLAEDNHILHGTSVSLQLN